MAPLTRNDFLAAGLELLAEEGAKAVTIANLCARLRVTKGSFYHHFDSGPAFLGDLLLYWEAEYGQRPVEAALAVGDPRDRMDLLAHLASSLFHEAETAIRVLAGTDAFAAEVQARVDRGREEVLAATFTEAGIPPERASRLARVGMAILVGIEQMRRPVDGDELLELFGEYRAWLEHAIERP